VDLATRIPEPELMDTPEQARAYAAADFTESHEAFVARFRERFPDLRVGRALDLGCGTADVTVRFARAYPAMRVDGVDGAPAMLDEGAVLVRTSDLADRVSLELRRLPDPALAVTVYDAVISNSLLHHLAEPGVLWTTVVAAAHPSARVFVMDLCRPPSTDVARRLVDAYARDESPVLRDDFYRSLCAAYTPDEVRAQLVDAGLAHFRVERAGDRHLLAWGRTRRW
jgi:cyclopropane fatty-acyl-phospholipid synthase-like methyltransferase